MVKETPTDLTGVAMMLVKKLGKEYKRKISVRAIPMEMPFSYNGTEGTIGDYLVLDDQGTASVMTAGTFRSLFGTARRGRKRKAITPLPPVEENVSRGTSGQVIEVMGDPRKYDPDHGSDSVNG